MISFIIYTFNFFSFVIIMTVNLIVDLVCHNFDFPSHSYDLVIFFYFYVLIMTIYLIVDLVS